MIHIPLINLQTMAEALTINRVWTPTQSAQAFSHLAAPREPRCHIRTRIAHLPAIYRLLTRESRTDSRNSRIITPQASTRLPLSDRVGSLMIGL